MTLSRITPLLACSLLFSAQAMAQDRPISDHSNTITIEPFQLLGTVPSGPGGSPSLVSNLAGEWEQSLSDKSGIAGGIQVGQTARLRGNSELWFLGDTQQVRVNTMGVNSSYNYYFKNFNRGWYAGAKLKLFRDVEKVDGETNSTHNVVSAGPRIGYKIATKGGFTFVWDMGLGLQSEIGESTSEDGTDIIYPGLVGLGKLSLGYSF